MKIGSKLLITCSSLALLSACSAAHNSQLDKTEWLIGTWENKTPEGSLYEKWGKISETEFSGMSFVIDGQDTVVFETIRLVQEQGKLVYIPTASGQNGGQAIRFPLTKFSESKLIFENPTHDFPQFITYTKLAKDSLIAEISGSVDGKESKQAFPMRRLK